MKQEKINILNIGAGKQKPLDINNDHYNLINIDPIYYKNNDISPQYIESMILNNVIQYPNKKYYLSEYANTFMEKTILKFDLVCIYRYLEHIPMNDILYFIYLVSTVMEKGSCVDVIVPNYKTLSSMLLQYDDKYMLGEMVGESIEFDEYNVLLTTEMLNDKSDPHCSIWTPNRLQYFWELEKRFAIKTIYDDFEYDQRNIYCRAIIERI